MKKFYILINLINFMTYKLKLKILLEELKQQGINDKNVLNALEKIPRHLFIPERLQEEAYGNYPLEIGHRQTISQPYTTAFMLQALELKENDKVLEVGTGSGWSTALTAFIIKPGKVYSIETIPELSKSAKENIKRTKLKNIQIFIGDGGKGLKKFMPYDKIIVNAACSKLPKILINQLKFNGVLLAPIGNLYEQDMIKVVKEKNKIITQNLGGFIFVPLISDEYGF